MSTLAAPSRTKFLRILLALVTVAVPLIVLYGWSIGSVVLTRIVPSVTPMNPVTASTFLIIGTAFLASQLGPSRLRNVAFMVAGGAAALVGALMLSYYLFGIDLGIDRLLFIEKLGINRLAPPTAANFFLIGVALLTFFRLAVVSRFAYGSATLVAMYALAAYLYNFVGVYGIAVLNPMAIHTATLFICVGTYLFLSEPPSSSESSARAGIRTVALFLIMAVGVGISSYLYSDTRKDAHNELYRYAEEVARLATPEFFSNLSGSEDDILDPAYQQLKEQLVTWRSGAEGLSFGYFLGKNARNEIVFYVDSEDPSSPDYSPPGQVYYEASPVLQSVFVSGERRIEGPITDRWGTWLSAFVPVIDDEGTVVAVAGVDMRADEYLGNVGVALGVPLAVALVLSLLILLHARVRRRTA